MAARNHRSEVFDLRKLLCYLRDYRKECFIGPFFKFMEACFELIVPLVMAKIIDVGIANGDKAYIFRMAGVLIGLGLLGFVCAVCAQYFAAKASVGMGTLLRQAVFQKIMRFSYADIDRVGAPTLITRVTADINQVQAGVNLGLRLLLRSPFIVVGAIVMSFIVNARMAVIFAVTTPLIGFVIYAVMRRSIPYYQKIQGGIDKVSQLTRENLSGVRVIRAFSRQEDEKRRFREESDKLFDTQVHAGRISALLTPINFVIINLAVIAILYFGSFRVNTGDLTQGEVTALVNYMSQVLIALVALANLIISLTKAMASATRVAAVLDLPLAESPAVPGPQPEKSAAAVTFDHVSFAYDGTSATSLSDISFTAAPGQTIGIIGGTGSGKTTLVNLLMRFYDATGGRILLFGNDIRTYDDAALRALFGVVPQKSVLFRGTIRDNIRWGKPDATDAEIRAALETAQAAEFVDRLSGGLDAPIEQGGRNLSGGQRQRLCIARALVGRPPVLVLDDSASALDFATDARLRKAIRTSTADATVFLISQRAATIMNADRILVLDDGRIVGSGTHMELLSACPVYREICQSQLSGNR